MDLGTGLAIFGSKDIIDKLLGPTVDYLGDGLRSFTQNRVENVDKILQNAWTKLKTLGKAEINGVVSPKVLKGVINDGSYAEDFLSIDYFGGVLASSRTDVPYDDRGAYFNALISRLSTYQLRMHYVFYHALKREFNGEDINFGLSKEAEKLRLFMPFSLFVKAMGFQNKRTDQIDIYLMHIINGLTKEQLIDSEFVFGKKEHIQKHFKEAFKGGLIIQPSTLGFELFYWAYGLGTENFMTFFQKDKHFKIDEQVVIDNNCKRII